MVGFNAVPSSFLHQLPHCTISSRDGKSVSSLFPRQRAVPSFQMFGFISDFFNNKTSFPKKDLACFWMILISVKISPFSQSLVQSDCGSNPPTCQQKEVRGGCSHPGGREMEENTKTQNHFPTGEDKEVMTGSWGQCGPTKKYKNTKYPYIRNLKGCKLKKRYKCT